VIARGGKLGGAWHTRTRPNVVPQAARLLDARPTDLGKGALTKISTANSVTGYGAGGPMAPGPVGGVYWAMQKLGSHRVDRRRGRLDVRQYRTRAGCRGRLAYHVVCCNAATHGQRQCVRSKKKDKTAARSGPPTRSPSQPTRQTCTKVRHSRNYNPPGRWASCAACCGP
jgi:hypothetical protein